MSTKNFGLRGVGSDVQFGKAGGRLVFDNGEFEILSVANSLINVSVATPTEDDHATTKLYVDNLAAGLKARTAADVLVDTNLVATYDNGTAGVGATLTADSNGAFPATDGVASSVLNTPPSRFLVTAQTNPAHNGLYVLQQAGDGSTPWILRRCVECDTAEKIPGSFVFIISGTTYANTGWVASVDDPSTFTVGTDSINWVQFSGVGSLTGGQGIDVTGTTVSLDFQGLSGGNISGSDEIAFWNGSNHLATTATTFISDLQILTNATFGTDGLLTRTGAGTYASRTLTASTTAGLEGLAVTNGDGVAGNPTVGLDITSLTADTSPAGGYQIVANDGTNNVRVQLSDILSSVTGSRIENGNSNVDIDTAGGDVTVDVGGTTTATFSSTALTLTTDLEMGANDINVGAGGSVTVADLDAGRIVFTTTGGELTSSADLAYAGTDLTLASGDLLVTGGGAAIEVGELQISSDTITSTEADGDIRLIPTGTGDVIIGSAGAAQIVADDEQNLTVAAGAGADGGDLILAAGDGSSSDGQILLQSGDDSPVSIDGVTASTYAGLVTAGDGNAIPNKEYVDNAVNNISTNSIEDGNNSVVVDDVTDTITFTTDGTTAGTFTTTGLELDNLTTGRVVIVGADGLLTDDAELTYNAGTDTLTTAVIVGTTSVAGGNLTLAGNTVSSTNANGDIVLNPNGTGNTSVDSGHFSVGNLRLDGNTLLSTNTNGDVVIAPNGDGGIELNVGASAPAITITGISAAAYAALIDTTSGNENALVNREYVDNQFASLSAEQIVNGNTSVNIPSAGGDVIVTVGGAGVAEFTSAGLELANLTATEVLFAGADGLVTSDAAFTYDDGSDTLTVVNLDGTLVDGGNLRMSGNTLASTDTNGDITISPDGSGILIVAANLQVSEINTASGDLVLDPAGDIDVAGSKIVDLLDPTNDQDAATKAYVDSQVTAAADGAVRAVTATVDLGTDGATNIGAALPTNAVVVRVSADVTVAADAAATLEIGITGDTDAFMADDENDPEEVALYVANKRVAASGEQVIATVADSNSAGSAVVVVEYFVPA